MGKLTLMLAVLGACGGSPKAPAAPANHAAPGGGPVTLAWQAVQGEGEQVVVTAEVAGTTVDLGTLAAEADDAEGTPATCSIGDKGTPTRSTFTCGRTPAYNYVVADLAAGQLVFTLVTGVDDEPASEHRTELQRVPVTGDALSVAPYAPPTSAPAP